MSSRCISGTHEAHGSYRVMSVLSGVGMAAGVAAALAARRDADDCWHVPAAQIRHELRRQGGALRAISNRHRSRWWVAARSAEQRNNVLWTGRSARHCCERTGAEDQAHHDHRPGQVLHLVPSLHNRTPVALPCG